MIPTSIQVSLHTKRGPRPSSLHVFDECKEVIALKVTEDELVQRGSTSFIGLHRVRRKTVLFGRSSETRVIARRRGILEDGITGGRCGRSALRHGPSQILSGVA